MSLTKIIRKQIKEMIIADGSKAVEIEKDGEPTLVAYQKGQWLLSIYFRQDFCYMLSPNRKLHVSYSNPDLLEVIREQAARWIAEKLSEK